VVDSSGKAHTQPLGQGFVLLHDPWQAANPRLPFFNCRAESVPAQRTAVIIVASNVFLIAFLLMVCSPFRPSSLMRGLHLCYLPAGASPAGRVVQNAVNGVVKEQKQPLAQGCVELQLPPQANPLTPLRNWRAETVPAHRTDVTMAANNMVLAICLGMSMLLCVKDPGDFRQRRQRSCSRPRVV
jgi:hypothetical protein